MESLFGSSEILNGSLICLIRTEMDILYQTDKKRRSAYNSSYTATVGGKSVRIR